MLNVLIMHVFMCMCVFTCLCVYVCLCCVVTCMLTWPGDFYEV